MAAGLWVRKTSGMTEEELDELNHLRVRFVEKTDGLVQILKQRSKTVKDVTLAVYEYIAPGETAGETGRDGTGISGSF